MFDFQSILNEADKAVEQKEYAIAIFNYWLVDFAFNDEDFPSAYTNEIGQKADEGFEKYIKEYKNDILNSSSYIQYKNSLKDIPAYQKYFKYFEREIKTYLTI